jgi:predicted transcriptional regulator
MARREADRICDLILSNEINEELDGAYAVLESEFRQGEPVGERLAALSKVEGTIALHMLIASTCVDGDGAPPDLSSEETQRRLDEIAQRNYRPMSFTARPLESSSDGATAEIMARREADRIRDLILSGDKDDKLRKELDDAYAVLATGFRQGEPVEKQIAALSKAVGTIALYELITSTCVDGIIDLSSEETQRRLDEIAQRYYKPMSFTARPLESSPGGATAEIMAAREAARVEAGHICKMILSGDSVGLRRWWNDAHNVFPGGFREGRPVGERLAALSQAEGKIALCELIASTCVDGIINLSSPEERVALIDRACVNGIDLSSVETRLDEIAQRYYKPMPFIARPLEITKIANEGTEVTAGRKNLGRGIINTVGLRAFSHSGQTSKYAVKPFSGEAIEDFCGARTAFGIQVSPPTSVRDFSIDIASRNQVARGVAKYLGDLTGVENPTVPIVKSHAVSNKASDESIELFMDVAPGKTAYETFYGLNRPSLVPLGQGEFVRQDTWLQINDFIVGQKDRHAGNVMCDFTDTGCNLTGIDNDTCLDTQDSVPYQKMNYDRTPPLAALPYIDREMYRAICSMSRAEIAQIMLNNGRDISRKPYGVEFQRMCTRITRLQSCVRLLARRGRVLETREDWQKAEVIKRFGRNDTYVKIHSHST